jgi:hypothetical protein
LLAVLLKELPRDALADQIIAAIDRGSSENAT